MSRERPCPGCGDDSKQVACAPCLSRVPTKLPWVAGALPRTWQPHIPRARRSRDSSTVDRIHNAVRTWLLEHPA